MNNEGWYVVKRGNEQCEIVSADRRAAESEEVESSEQWGPFASQAEAIARRVGLIRAGKCKPA